MVRTSDNRKSAYSRRIERAMARGLSRSQARGHPKAGETYASGNAPKSDDRIAEAVSAVRMGESLNASAKRLKVSRERVRQALSAHGDYVRQGSRYRFVPKARNDLPLYSAGDSIRVIVDAENAARLGSYMASVGWFLDTQKSAYLLPFIGKGVIDVKGKFHPFETDLENLYRIEAKGRAIFHQIYQLSN